MAFPTLKPKKELATIVGSESGPSSEMMKRIWAYIKSEKGVTAKLQEGKKLWPDRDPAFKKLVASAKTIEKDADGSINIFQLPRIIKELTERV